MRRFVAAARWTEDILILTTRLWKTIFIHRSIVSEHVRHVRFVIQHCALVFLLDVVVNVLDIVVECRRRIAVSNAGAARELIQHLTEPLPFSLLLAHGSIVIRREDMIVVMRFIMRGFQSSLGHSH